MNHAVKILIVDDEILILHSLMRVLADCDFDVTTSASSEEALRLFETVGPFDIVLSDYMMPGLNGVDLLALVNAKYADTVGIIMSAHANMPVITKAIGEGYIKHFVAKPWNHEALLKLVTDEAQAIKQVR